MKHVYISTPTIQLSCPIMGPFAVLKKYKNWTSS